MLSYIWLVDEALPVDGWVGALTISSFLEELLR